MTQKGLAALVMKLQPDLNLTASDRLQARWAHSEKGDGQTPEAFEGLSWAAWWLDDARVWRLAASAAELGRRFGVADLEMLRLALEGATLVACAQVEGHALTRRSDGDGAGG